MSEVWINRERCLHCLSCVLSCAAAHSRGRDLYSAIKDGPNPRIFTVRDESGYFPLNCRHCENAPCVEACISAAITKNAFTGEVVVDTERCAGCWTCVMVCPFGVIGRDEDKKVAVKCDHCSGREIPACAESCPTGALEFKSAGDYTDGKRHLQSERIAGSGGRSDR